MSRGTANGHLDTIPTAMGADFRGAMGATISREIGSVGVAHPQELPPTVILAIVVTTQ